VRVIPQEGGRAWIQCGDIPICLCESIEKAEIVMDMLLEGVTAREELAQIKRSFYSEKFDDSVALFEIHLLSSALGLADYNMSKAARALGLKRTTLFEKAKRYGILEKTDGCESIENNEGTSEAGDVCFGSASCGEGVPGSAGFGFITDLLSGSENANRVSERAAAAVCSNLDREKNHSGDNH